MARSALCICSISLRKLLSHTRTKWLLAFLFIVLDYHMGGIRSFCIANSVTVSLPAQFALALNDPDIHSGLVLLFAFLLCDSPGRDSIEPYMILRGGRLTWICGKMLYVVTAMLIYLTTTLLLTGIVIRHVDFSVSGWGKAILTLAQTNASSAHNIYMRFDARVLALYAPASALLLSGIMNMLLFIFLGFVNLALNITTHRPVGSFTVGVFALIAREVGGFTIPESFYRFSPVSLTSLSIINKGYLSEHPTLQYSLWFLTIGIVVSGMVNVFYSLRMNVDSQAEESGEGAND